MKPEVREKWGRTRAKGKLDYVLKAGVLSYGLPMFLIMTFFVNRSRLSPKFISISALLWLLGGVLFGVAMWHVQESRFKAASATDQR
jgi:hypothetical protein